MPRAQKCVFIGYSLSQKSYKVYNLETKEVVVIKDVVFYEHNFPYHQKEENNKIYKFFLPINTGEVQTPNLNIKQDFLENDLEQETQSEQDIESPQLNQDTQSDIDQTTIMEISQGSRDDCANNPKKSQRTTKTPTYLKDYHCHRTLVWPC
jgi:hypothetical protein